MGDVNGGLDPRDGARRKTEFTRDDVMQETLTHVRRVGDLMLDVTERHADGDLAKSIEHNAERFGYGEDVKRLLVMTARQMSWID